MKEFLKKLFSGKIIPVGSASEAAKPLKLNEIIRKIENGDFSSETRGALYKALRRSNDDFLRCQHCWILAYNICKKYGSDALVHAIDLIDQCFDSFPNASGYERGELWRFKSLCYSMTGHNAEAEDCLRKSEVAFAAHWKTVDRKKEVGELDFDFLYSLLKTGKCCYSKELEERLMAVQSKPFLQTRQVRFITQCAKAIVCKEKDDLSGWKEAIAEAMKAISGDTPAELANRLRRHRIADELNVPATLLVFIQRQADRLHEEEPKP